MLLREFTIKTRCFVLGHDLTAPRKVRHHARKRQKCKRCGTEVMTLIPFVEQDAEQQALSLAADGSGSTYKAKPMPFTGSADE